MMTLIDELLAVHAPLMTCATVEAFTAGLGDLRAFLERPSTRSRMEAATRAQAAVVVGAIDLQVASPESARGSLAEELGAEMGTLLVLAASQDVTPV